MNMFIPTLIMMPRYGNIKAQLLIMDQEVVYIYRMKYYAALRKNKTIQYSAT